MDATTIEIGGNLAFVLIVAVLARYFTTNFFFSVMDLTHIKERLERAEKKHR